MRVLYIEDSDSDADLARRMLQRLAPEIVLEVAPTLELARAALARDRSFDVVLLDLGLPDGSGLVFLAEIHERDHSPAVIVLTGSGEQEAALAALKAGADDYVTKRDDYLSSLPEILRAACTRHREHARLRRSRRMRVLYAEPNPFDVDLAQRHFARHAPHMRLETVGVAQEVIELLSGSAAGTRRFDAVVLDYRLPGVDGLELVRLLRHQLRLDLPIILLTGHGSGEVAAKALRLGVDDYLPKREGYLYELAVTLEKLQSQMDLKRERAELAESEKRFRNLFEFTPAISVQGYDTDGNVLYWNRASEKLYGYSAEKAHGRNLADLIIPDAQREAVRGEVRRWIEEGQPVPAVELELQNSAGQKLHVLSSLIVMSNLRGDKELYCFDIDVSDRVALHGLQQARSDVLNRIATDQPLDEVLAGIILHVERLAGSDGRVDILFADEDGRVLADVRRAGAPVLCSALALRCMGAREEEVIPANVGDGSPSSLWCVPLRDEAGTVIGMFVQSSVGDQEPDERCRAVGREFASLVSLAVQKRRVGDAVFQREAGLEMSARATLELLRDADLDCALQVVLEDLGRNVGVDRAYVFELHSETPGEQAVASLRQEWCAPKVTPHAALGDMSAVDVGHPVFATGVQKLRRGEILCGDREDFRAEVQVELRRFGVLSVLMLPVFVRESLWGVIGLETVRRRRQWTQSEESMLRIVAAGISAATERKLALDSLRQAAAVFQSTRDGVVITGLDGTIIAINRAYSEITGFTEGEVVGRKSSVVRSERQSQAFYHELWSSLKEHGHWQGEIWNRRKDGVVCPQWLSISTVSDDHGQPIQYVGVMTDISKLKNSEAELQRMAHYDPLTSLPNRVLVNLRLEHAIDQARRYGQMVGVLFIDLDRFKDVNDSYGHPVGDELLVKIAARLKERVRADDTLARLGGDEFLMIMERVEDPQELAVVALALIRLFDQPYLLSGGQEVYVGSSIGISCYPEDGVSPTELIQHADAALYQAKADGRSTYRFFTVALSQAAQRRVEIETRMRRAFERGEFELHYQPQIEVGTERIVGCEALLRWRDPELGLVPPADFIPVAEENGLIVPLGEWTLRRACEQARAWELAGLPPLTMAVNLSGRQLWQADLSERIAQIIEETGMTAERLELELTESTIMGHEVLAGERLQALKALGVTLAIDDFGTGYSSLAYLKRFPIDVLKIDREFVRDLPHDVSDMEIAAAIVAMARNLRMRVVAEGVETGEQLDFLRDHSCDLCQGFLFSPPVQPDAFARLVTGGARVH